MGKPPTYLPGADRASPDTALLNRDVTTHHVLLALHLVSSTRPQPEGRKWEKTEGEGERQRERGKRKEGGGRQQAHWTHSPLNIRNRLSRISWSGGCSSLSRLRNDPGQKPSGNGIIPQMRVLGNPRSGKKDTNLQDTYFPVRGCEVGGPHPVVSGVNMIKYPHFPGGHGIVFTISDCSVKKSW